MKPKKKKLNKKQEIARLREIGRAGGLATKKKHGISHYKKAGRKGGEATKKRWGDE